MTWGNQKWNGNIPILIIRLKNKIKFLKLKVSIVWGKLIRLKHPKRINEDPKAWTKKYFKLLSTSRLFILQIIRGIKDNKFTSNPIQTYNQLPEDIDINLPIIKLNKKKKKKGIYIIKERRESNSSN